MDPFEKHLKKKNSLPDFEYSNFSAVWLNPALLLGAKKRAQAAGDAAYLLLTTNYPPGEDEKSARASIENIKKWRDDRRHDMNNENKKVISNPEKVNKYREEINTAGRVINDYEDIIKEAKQAAIKSAADAKQKVIDDQKAQEDADNVAKQKAAASATPYGCVTAPAVSTTSPTDNKKLLMYGGIGAAALVIIIVIVKSRTQATAVA